RSPRGSCRACRPGRPHRRPRRGRRRALREGISMTYDAARAVAVVGVGAILPDAPDAPAFWRNVRDGHYAISEVDPARWDPELYWDADPPAPEKTHSKIGGWVRDWEWGPLARKLPTPPKVGDAMDGSQKWAVAGTRMALQDYGWPQRALD